jgi:hypothetical protein
MKRGGGFLKPNDAGATLVDIDAQCDLLSLLDEPRRYRTSSHAAHFHSNRLALSFLHRLEQPVRMFLSLEPANNAPFAVSMSNGQCNRLRAILGDPVMVMLRDVSRIDLLP